MINSKNDNPQAMNRPSLPSGNVEPLSEPRPPVHQDKEGDQQMMNLLSVVPGVIFQLKIGPDKSVCFPWFNEGSDHWIAALLKDIEQRPAIVYDKIPSEDRIALWQALQESTATLHPLEIQFRLAVDPESPSHHTLDGWIWMLCRASVQRTESGATLWTGVLLDITKFKETETKLKESEQRYRTLAEAARDFIFIVDDQDRVVYINQYAARLWNVKPEEIIGKPRSTLFPTENALRQRAVIDRVLQTGQPFSGETVTILPGGPQYLDTRLIPLPDANGHHRMVMGIARDISARKIAEQALKESEERFRSIFDLSPDSITLTDLEGNVIECNQATLAMNGCAHKDELLGKNSLNFIAEEDRPRAVDYIMKTLSEGAVYNLEYQLLRKDGKKFFADMAANLLHDAAGKPKGFIGITRDVTERKRWEETIKESEERFRTIFDLSPYSIVQVDLAGSIIACNQTTLTMHEYTDKKELLGKDSMSLIAAKDQNRTAESLSQIVTLGIVKYIECNFVTKNGREFEGDLSSSLIYDSAGQPTSAIAIARDISEIKRAQESRRALEAKLQQTQKLESLGLLAGGIAHDFNNLLTGILGYVSLSLSELAPNSPLRDNISQIELSTRRAAELTRQLLAYSGKGRFQLQVVHIDQVVDEMAHLLQVSISKKCLLQVHFQPGLPCIEVDASQLRQVTMNLILNASEAIGERSGVISVSTGAVYCNRDTLARFHLGEDRTEGLYVFLEVTDTGCGMSEEIRAKMFDPFFSTKFTGRGLGLAAVLGIMRGHLGAISVSSQPGQGTTIRLLFPASDKEMIPVSDQKAATIRHSGQGTVLVVDDEESVRALTQKVLSGAGYQVLVAQDGRQGVELFTAHADEIQLVLLDLTMPRLDGTEALKEIKKVRENVRVVLSSGYNEQDVAHRFEGQFLNGFIQKPYTADELLRVVEQVLTH